MVRRNAGGPAVAHGLDTSFLVATEFACHADHIGDHRWRVAETALPWGRVEAHRREAWAGAGDQISALREQDGKSWPSCDG